MKTALIIHLFILCSSANARGMYCATDSCEENTVFLVYWLGYIAIYLFVFGNKPAKQGPRIAYIASWLIVTLIAMLVALYIQAEIFNLKSNFGMLLVGLTGYAVFWLGMYQSLKNSNKANQNGS